MARIIALFLVFVVTLLPLLNQDVTATRTGCHCESCCLESLQRSCRVRNHFEKAKLEVQNRRRRRLVERRELDYGNMSVPYSDEECITISDLVSIARHFASRYRRNLNSIEPTLGRRRLLLEDVAAYISEGVDILTEDVTWAKERVNNISDAVEVQYVEFKGNVVNATEEMKDSIEARVLDFISNWTSLSAVAFSIFWAYFGGFITTLIIFSAVRYLTPKGAAKNYNVTIRRMITILFAAESYGFAKSLGEKGAQCLA
jgi:hypothetical protein